MRSFVFLFLFLFSSFLSLRATHIAGGDFSVRWVSGNDYEVTLKLFRDCASGGAAFDNPINITVFDNVTNAVITVFPMNLISNTPIVLGDECYSPPATVCIEEGLYRTTVTLANNPNGYYMAWERCCRNPTIVNLTNPNSSGMVFYVQVPDPLIQNSTPEFGAYPAAGYLCINTLNTIDFDVTEADGDSLVFSLVDPYMGSLSSSGNPAPNSANPKPYVTCPWAAPYSLADIVGGSPVMSINPQTGIITCTPSAIGVFAFAVLCEEYRGGVKISETRREIQYYVLNCVFDNLPTIMLPDTVTIEVLKADCFDVVVIDPDNADTVSITVNSNTFPLGAYMTLPPAYQTAPDTLYYFTYIDSLTGNLDSILLPAATQIGNSFFGFGGVGLRYCWYTECEDLAIPGFNLDVAAWSLGCSGDTNSIHRDVVIEIGPPEGIEEIVPNVFSPNNDGINDYFKIEGTPNPCWDALTVAIYNRWGLLVYESSEVEFKWDGKSTNGKDLPEGTYFVILNGIFGDKDVTSQYPVTLFRAK